MAANPPESRIPPTTARGGPGGVDRRWIRWGYIFYQVASPGPRGPHDAISKLLEDVSIDTFAGGNRPFFFWQPTSAKPAVHSAHIASFYLFRIARAGIFPRSSLLAAGQLGFWEFGKGGTVGWRVGQIGSVYKQPETEVDDSCHSWRVPSKWKGTQRGSKGEPARGEKKQGELRHVYM